MPSASTSPPTKKGKLQEKFTAAATALADLYRESSDAYEEGYRDAILFVQRYLQGNPLRRGVERDASSAAAASRSDVVHTQRMILFLRDTITARQERVALIRGTYSLRRRCRGEDDDAEHSCDSPDRCEGDSEQDEAIEEEEREGGAPAAPSPPSSIHLEPPPSMTLSPSAAAASSLASLPFETQEMCEASPSPPAREIEHRTQMNRRPFRASPQQPWLYCPRVERTHCARRTGSVVEHPSST